jgi:hypothetical protein
MEGEYTPSELRAEVLAGLDDPSCPPAPVLLFDLRASTAVTQRTSSDLQEMARFLVSIRHRYASRLAMVTGSEVGYGQMRIGAVFAAQGGVAPSVFRDMAEARTWLLEA